MTAQDFPILYANRKAHARGGPSFNRLVRLAMRKFMLFVVRLHYATHVASVGGVDLPPTKDAWVFTFDMFPQLKTVLTKVERALHKMHSKTIGGDDDEIEFVQPASAQGKQRQQHRMIEISSDQLTEIQMQLAIMQGIFVDLKAQSDTKK